jgi:hypothetical protein
MSELYRFRKTRCSNKYLHGKSVHWAGSLVGPTAGHFTERKNVPCIKGRKVDMHLKKSSYVASQWHQTRVHQFWIIWIILVVNEVYNGLNRITLRHWSKNALFWSPLRCSSFYHLLKANTQHLQNNTGSRYINIKCNFVWVQNVNKEGNFTNIV